MTKFNYFKSRDVIRILGVTQKQLDYWDKTGVAHPSVLPASGKGTTRCYSFKDLIALKMIKNFRDNNIGLKRIQKSIAFLHKELKISKPLAGMSLIIYGNSICLKERNGDLLVDTLNNGQLVWYFPMDSLIEEVKVSIQEYYGSGESKKGNLAEAEA